jgi:dipeptidase E
LEVSGERITLKGPLKARIFEYNKEAYEVQPGTDLSLLR